MAELIPTLSCTEDVRSAHHLLLAAHPGLATLAHIDLEFERSVEMSPFDALFKAIVHQQLSSKAANAIYTKVKSLHPEGLPPDPELVLRTPTEELRAKGLSGNKVKAIQDLAEKTVRGVVPSLKEAVSMPDEELIERLVGVFGVGRWTVEMLLIFNLGRADVLPVDDYSIRKAATGLLGHTEMVKPKALAEFGEIWAPHRTTVSLLLWQSLA